ncbi:MAG: broad specificity phosphatase PhoE [Planctomycetota bacterium]|jgi:broad specificity phosphatase PhoE
MELIAIRHGETEYNKEKRAMGSRIDVSLTEQGREQAREKITELVKYGFSAIYASPLLRTRETAEIINAELGLPISFHEELKERDVGTLSGMLYDDIGEKLGEAAISSTQYDFREFEGENTGDVHARIRSFIEMVESKHSEKEFILVVTHAEVIRVLYGEFASQVSENISNVCVHDFGTDKTKHNH